MTYRGQVKNGVIVLENAPVLPEGAAVEVRPLDNGKTDLSDRPAFGLWRDRKELNDPVAGSLKLRRMTEERASGV